MLSDKFPPVMSLSGLVALWVVLLTLPTMQLSQRVSRFPKAALILVYH